MKNALKITFGTMLAASTVASVSAHEGSFLHRTAVYVSGAYATSTANGLSMGDQFLGDLGNGATDFFAAQPKFFDMDADWEYGLGLTYHAPNSNTRFFLHFDHFQDDKDESFVGGSIIRNLGITASVHAAGAHVEHHANAFKIGFNHMFHQSKQFHINMGAYFEWDKARRLLNESVLLNNALFSRTTDQEFEGWGPGIGLLARAIPFASNPSWGVFASAHTALLYGDNEYEQVLNRNNPGTPILYQYSPENSKSIVNKFEIDLGVDYGRIFRTDAGRFLIDLAVGVKYMNMVNVFKNGNTAFNSFGADWGMAVNTGTPNDWGRVGPFIKFKIGGANA